MGTGNKRILTGTVIESKMEKTAVVQITRRFPHPIYKKFVTRNKKYYAHDESNQAKAGDIVRIIESRPASRLKRWRLLGIETSSSEV